MGQTYGEVATLVGQIADENHEQLIKEVIGDTVYWGIDQGKPRELGNEFVEGEVHIHTVQTRRVRRAWKGHVSHYSIPMNVVSIHGSLKDSKRRKSV
jgi:hypothetical protein